MRRMFSKNQLEQQTEELLASGNLPSVKADEIIENMSGYDYIRQSGDFQEIYVGAVKNGNKLTIAYFGKYKVPSTPGAARICYIDIPDAVGSKLYPFNVGGSNTYLDSKAVTFLDVNSPSTYHSNLVDCEKTSNTRIEISLRTVTGFSANEEYYFRYEVTFLLSENLAE